MDFADAIRCDGASFQAAGINPFWDTYVRFRFELQIAFARVLGIVVLESALEMVALSPMNTISYLQEAEGVRFEVRPTRAASRAKRRQSSGRGEPVAVSMGC